MSRRRKCDDRNTSFKNKIKLYSRCIRARIVVTKVPQTLWVAKNTSNLLLCSSGSVKLERRCRHGWFLWGPWERSCFMALPHFLVVAWHSSTFLDLWQRKSSLCLHLHMVFPLWLHRFSSVPVHASSSHGNLVLTNYIYSDPVPRFCHIMGVLGIRTSTSWFFFFFRGHNSTHSKVYSKSEIVWQN